MSFGGSKSGFIDTKNFRKNILTKANERLGVISRLSSEGNGTVVNKDSGMLSLLDSSYTSEVPSTNYSLHLKAIAFESARALVIAEEVRDDIYFKSTRSDYLSQNIASFLFPYNRFSTTDKTDEESRDFYFSIIEAYFGGSNKDNIQKSLIKFLKGIDVSVIERFLLARQNPVITDPYINKFIFDATVSKNDPRIKDISKVQADIEFLLRIIKPAHTNFTTNILFNDYRDDYLAKAIVDDVNLDLFDYKYEDLRKPFNTVGTSIIKSEVIQQEDFSRTEGSVFQASPRIVYSNVGGNWASSDPTYYHTKYGPFGKDDGSLADNVNDIVVTVDGIQVEVVEIIPLSAVFKLAEVPSASSVIRVNYNVVTNYTGGLITNNLDSVLNNWNNYATEHTYKTVLSPFTSTGSSSSSGAEPDVKIWEAEYRYKGLDLFNSSVLNNPQTLNLNEPDSRSRLNDYNVFKSHRYDSGNYTTTLKEGTPLFPISLDLKNFWRRLKGQEFILNNTEFSMNTVEDRMFGEIHEESYKPFYSVLEVETKDNGGQKGHLQTITEDLITGLFIDLSRTWVDHVNNISKEIDKTFYISPLSSMEGHPASSDSSSGYISLSNSEFLILNGGASWEVLNTPTRAYGGYLPAASGYPEEADVNVSFGGDGSQMHILVHDVHLEKFQNIGQIEDFKQELKEIAYYNIFTQNYQERISEEIYRLRHIVNEDSLIFRSNRSILSSNPSPTDIIDGSLTSITKIKNVTKGLDYDLANMILMGDKVIKLDNTLPNNISIGYTNGDVIQMDYNSIDRVNDNYDISYIHPNDKEIKFIIQNDASEILSIFNVTKSSSYSLDNLNIIGKKVISLDKSNPVNKDIGLSIYDEIRISYKKDNITKEICSANPVYGNFLKLKINTSNTLLKLISVKNISKDKYYDITDFLNLDGNIILLNDDINRNIYIGQSPDDVFEIELISKTSTSTINNELATLVETPSRFRFFNEKSILEFTSVFNVSKQLSYDLTDFSDVTASTGGGSAENILIKGTSSVSGLNTLKKWESKGSNDSFTETLLITFKNKKSLDCLNLLDHNWKDYEISFINNDININTITINGNDKENTVHKFKRLEADKILIKIKNTITYNQEKYLNRIFYLLEDVIELEYCSAENHLIGLEYNDIIYSNTRTSQNISDVEPWMTFPRANYSRSIFDVYPI